MIATEKVVYVLYSDKTLEALDASDIEKSVAKTAKLEKLGEAAGEAVTFAYVEHNQQIWVGDNKGFVHCLNSESLELLKDIAPLKTHYGHPCHSMTSQGDRVAVGDSKGYTTIYDASSMANIAYFAVHSNKVLYLQFSADKS